MVRTNHKNYVALTSYQPLNSQRPYVKIHSRLAPIGRSGLSRSLQPPHASQDAATKILKDAGQTDDDIRFMQGCRRDFGWNLSSAISGATRLLDHAAGSIA